MRFALFLSFALILAFCPCPMETRAHEHEHDCDSHQQEREDVGLCCGSCCESSAVCGIHKDIHLDYQQTQTQPLRISAFLPVFSAHSQSSPPERQDELLSGGLPDLTGTVILRC